MLNDRLIETIKNRRSIRKFTDEIIKDKEIMCLIESAASAPSNNNRQPWKFIVIRNEEKKKEIADAVLKKIVYLKSQLKNEEMQAVIDSYKDYLLFVKNAPVLMLVLYKRPLSIVSELSRELKMKGIEGMEQNELISTSMAIQNLLLAAHALGLGACCSTGPLIAAHEIKNIFGICPPFEPAAIVALGHYDVTPEAPARKPVKDIMEVIE